MSEKYMRQEVLEAGENILTECSKAVERLAKIAIEKSKDGLQFEVYMVEDGFIGLDVNGEPYTTNCDSEQEIEYTIGDVCEGFKIAKESKPDLKFTQYENGSKLLPVYRCIDMGESEEKKHDGKPFMIVRRLTKQECDEECMPMWKIRFDDGVEIEAFPEEIYADMGETSEEKEKSEETPDWKFTQYENGSMLLPAYKCSDTSESEEKCSRRNVREEQGRRKSLCIATAKVVEEYGPNYNR